MEKSNVLLITDDARSQSLRKIFESYGLDVIDDVSKQNNQISLFPEDPSPPFVILDAHSNLDFDWLGLAKTLQKTRSSTIFIFTNYPELILKENGTDSNKDTARNGINGNAHLENESNSQQDVLNVKEGHYSFFKDIIFVKNEFVYQKIKIKDLNWVEAHRSYCEIATSKKKYLLSISLNTFGKLVNYPTILRVHRSYMVNIDKIDAFEGSKVYIGEKTIPIGTSYKDDFARIFPYFEKRGVLVH